DLHLGRAIACRRGHDPFEPMSCRVKGDAAVLERVEDLVELDELAQVDLAWLHTTKHGALPRSVAKGEEQGGRAREDLRTNPNHARESSQRGLEPMRRRTEGMKCLGHANHEARSVLPSGAHLAGLTHWRTNLQARI